MRAELFRIRQHRDGVKEGRDGNHSRPGISLRFGAAAVTGQPMPLGLGAGDAAPCFVRRYVRRRLSVPGDEIELLDEPVFDQAGQRD